MKELLLSIDHGTQSIRAQLFDLKGNLVDQNKVIIESYFSHQPGWAEQHADYFWQKTCEAVKGLMEMHQDKLKNIVGMSITTQRNSLVNLDKSGNPLRPVIIWLDQRRADVNESMAGPLGWILKLAGAEELVNHIRAECEANWIVQNQPEVWKKTEKFIFLSGYMTYKLTGEFLDSSGSIVGYVPFDYKKQAWASNRSWKWQLAPFRKQMFSELVSPGQQMGKLTSEAAKALGLPNGIPLIASAADKACEVLGAGVLNPDQACLSFGTTATINVPSQHYLEVQKRLPPFSAAVPNQYLSEITIYRGFWMVSWFKEQFAQPEIEKAKQLGIEVEALLDELIAEIPAGCQGLMLQPYWSQSNNQLGVEAKGAIIGFGDVHTRGHMYRAILEGLVFGLREGKEAIEAKTRKPISDIRIAGGGSQSVHAMQITADIFNQSVSRPHTYETSGLGAAINTAVGLGLHSNYQQAVGEMVREKDQFLPSLERAELYNDLFEKVYKKMYGRLRPLYKQIKQITGYPEN